MTTTTIKKKPKKCNVFECEKITTLEFCIFHRPTPKTQIKYYCETCGVQVSYLKKFCLKHAEKNYNTTPCQYKDCKRNARNNEFCTSHTEKAREKRKSYALAYNNKIKSSRCTENDKQIL